MAHFVLLHGGSHGGWCYEKLIALLEQRGHTAIAPDMAFDDASLSLIDHAQRVAEHVGDKSAVVVAHSMGGHIAPIVATMAPVTHLIMLCAVVPEPGRSMVEVTATSAIEGPSTVPAEALEFDAAGRCYFVSRDMLRKYLYEDCPDDVVDRAWARVCGTAPTIAMEPSPLVKWPDVPTTSIIGGRDRAVNPAWSRLAAARIGANVVEHPQSSHSPFYSQPHWLVDVLVGVAGDLSSKK